MQEVRERHDPEVVVDTTALSREEWLDWRKKGIGGSDVAGILGVSPFTTARDIYYDKLNIAPLADNEDNWVAMEVGNRLEDLVAKVFKKKMGCQLLSLKKIMRHPEYPFMFANLDYLVQFSDGSGAILECKTTNYNARGRWFDGDTEIIPFHYELQARHYMTVMDIDRVYFGCLYGNNENEYIIRCLDRDMEIEAELIAIEEDFWTNNVLAKVPPEYTEDGDLIAESVRKHFGAADADVPELVLSAGHSANIAEFLELQREKSVVDEQSRQLKTRMDKIKGLIADELGTGCFASCTVDGEDYAISYKPSMMARVDKDALLRLRQNLPDVYNEYVTVTESRRFYIKPKPVVTEAVAA